jgi:small GTP-binding protein
MSGAEAVHNLERLPVVAVVGRPNVGKSTLVNRIVGRRAAIVEEEPGVTRDRKELVAEWAGHNFRIVDTGGWLATEESLAKQVSRQAERAMTQADVILVVVDVTVGTTEEDAQVARILQRSGKPVLLVANKVDDPNRENDVWGFVKLGLGDPYAVSAIHGRGSGDLLDALVAVLPRPPAASGEDQPFSCDREYRTWEVDALQPAVGDAPSSRPAGHDQGHNPTPSSRPLRTTRFCRHRGDTAPGRWRVTSTRRSCR